ncbi:dTDP-4-dehydrorhamnose 3,5-epimerase family protein [Micromonospora sp. STR1_7]|uniref:dTDP-4-dehydrorhamnose 3,5-epimerase family protein n=1 Tax=Micromonospora parastrephiae TaxID=2806101 RepID=A0ABS1XQ56_9ACTN|nr:dTDP-4-dehydrorhamnose 3,5-epimerase [Micromonospora parastrephiae]MBM0231400.1 dTDP-4-dehydrorhamnose 3,5-epimerase family protein [Micromonospora parastrephiae]
MTSRPLSVRGAFEFTPKVFPDDRGAFLSPYQEPAFVAALGHRLFPVAQTNHSRSRRNVVRGLHFTLTPPGCAKYVYCPQGSALDIVVDIRVGSPTYGQWDAVLLDPEDFRAVYLPVGVGHAFIGLHDDTLMSYMISGSYVPEHELALSVLDPALHLPIPGDIEPILSDRDRVAPSLSEAKELGILPRYSNCLALEEQMYGRDAQRTDIDSDRRLP